MSLRTVILIIKLKLEIIVTTMALNLSMPVRKVYLGNRNIKQRYINQSNYSFLCIGKFFVILGISLKCWIRMVKILSHKLLQKLVMLVFHTLMKDVF